MRMTERKKANVFEMKTLRSMTGLTRRYRITNEEIRRKTGGKTKIEYRIDRSNLREFGQMESKLSVLCLLASLFMGYKEKIMKITK